jgi:ABC-type multidrug transport system ATPase subunit
MAERVIQRVAVMKHGKFVAFGTPGELKLFSGGNVRLEFRLKEGEHLNEAETQRLAELGIFDASRPGDYAVHLTANQVAAATDMLMTQVGMARLDDFKLSPPSLEDVYLQFENANG